MAYDPKDPETIAAVTAAVDAAVAEANEAHETATAGLKASQTKLRQDLAKARAGEGGDNGAEVERLEAALADANTKLKAAEKLALKSSKDLEALTGERDGLNKDLTSTLVDGGLTSALAENKIAAQYLPAVKALLTSKVTIETVDGQRRAMADGKPLGEFVKTWSQGDEGKAYVSAPANNGGGSGGSGNGQGGGKTMSRADYDAADANTRSAFFAEGGTLTD